MTFRPTDHLSPDAIDAFLAGTLDDAGRAHLADCALCREIARLERSVVDQLAALPELAPSPGFPDRVMARVRVPDPFALRSLAAARRRLFGGRSLGIAATVAVTLLGSLASIVWTLTHQALLLSAAHWLLAEGYAVLWVGIRGVASNLIEQPWYHDARRLLDSPARLAIGSAAASLLYVTGVLTLRRLLAVPAQRVAHAAA
jgi:hypothetical protein